ALPGPPHGAPFLFGQPAPHPRVLPRGDGPFQTVRADLAPHADGLGQVDLVRGGARVADGKEELGILVLAACSVDPLHALRSPPDRHNTGRLRRFPRTRRLKAAEYTDASFRGAMVRFDYFPGTFSLVVAHRGASLDQPENT